MTNQTINQRNISTIATDIIREWQKPSPYALPYLRAMLSLENKQSTYGYDDAKSVVLYFLSNASSFRGDKAKQLKNELKAAIK